MILHRASCRGFTILELMVVLVILGILMGAFVISAGGIFRKSAEREAATRLTRLAAAIEEHRQIEGGFPDDHLPSGSGGSEHNGGAEALFLALYDPAYSGSRPGQDWLVNTDNDATRKPRTTLPTKDLWEFGDPWLNPIVYFESLHYGEERLVLAGLDGLLDEQNVQAMRHPRTQGWEAPQGYQLISAGPDGEFGNEDDVTWFGD